MVADVGSVLVIEMVMLSASDLASEEVLPKKFLTASAPDRPTVSPRYATNSSKCAYHSLS